MPMIDVYAVKGTFGNKRELTKALNECLMRWEKVPHIHLFLDNTAAFVHDLEADAMANAAGDSNYVRIQILTPVGTLDREKKLGVDQRDDRHRRRTSRRSDAGRAYLVPDYRSAGRRVGHRRPRVPLDRDRRRRPQRTHGRLIAPCHPELDEGAPRSLSFTAIVAMVRQAHHDSYGLMRCGSAHFVELRIGAHVHEAGHAVRKAEESPQRLAISHTSFSDRPAARSPAISASSALKPGSFTWLANSRIARRRGESSAVCQFVAI